MEPPDFPPNSRTSKGDPPEPKVIDPVVQGGVKRKRRSLRKQFTETFVAGDAKTAARYAVLDIALPAARDMILETLQQGLEKLFLGEGRRYRGGWTPPGGATGYTNYQRYSSVQRGPYSSGVPYSPGPQRALSRQARARHNFDEIVLEERSEAEEVIDRLFDLVSRYESASVADLYELVGLASTHTDHKWGWTDLHGAGVSRVRGGYLLDLPDPEPLD